MVAEIAAQPPHSTQEPPPVEVEPAWWVCASCGDKFKSIAARDGHVAMYHPANVQPRPPEVEIDDDDPLELMRAQYFDLLLGKARDGDDASILDRIERLLGLAS